MNHGTNTELARKKILLHEDLTFKIIGSAREAYKHLGGGLLESVYEGALCYELSILNSDHKRQEWIDVHYKNTVFQNRFRADLIVEDKILIENKSIKALSAIEEAQLLNYLKLTRLKLGLIFNFGPQKFELKRRIL